MPPHDNHTVPAPGHDAAAGVDATPAAWLEPLFRRIAGEDMRDLPFFRPDVPVRACGFTLFERQWLGCLLTPWMLSLWVLPGPGQDWQPTDNGARLALALPCGNVTFIKGELAGRGPYLSCSLMSPLDAGLTGIEAVALAQHCVKMALSLPVRDGDAPPDADRRAWLTRGRGTLHA
ncbi:hydrogenase-2 assembly chaperone [Acerihabitans arboris]|uniref:Hydrogenase-2 assembly chaperone n=1 Tax=Acerihabitans arboris TaxID=2691583 RepID=A0A845SBP0_9GAMM|nr:hydrogenase-2 assembly chaperone [Acerihabitans arboris]NDL62253.1 hydrogenase-2 assembly chaperone [Acerihabitans arboris]